MIVFTTTNRDYLKVDMGLEEFETLLKGNWEFVTATDTSGHNPARVRTMHIVTWWEDELPHDPVYEQIAESENDV